MRAVLIRISTQEIIKKTNYPSLTIAPIASLDPDLKWLLVYNLPIPNYDQSIEKMVRFEQITETPHPDYPTIERYEIGYNIVPLSQAEIDAYNLQQEDIDQYGQKQQKRVNDGQEMTRRFFAYIHRQVGLGNLTANRASKTSNYMLNGITFLNFGEMELAKNSFNNVDLSSETVANQTAIQINIDKAIQIIDNYITNE